MIVIKLFLITLIIQHNEAEFMQQFRPFTPAFVPQPPLCPQPQHFRPPHIKPPVHTLIQQPPPGHLVKELPLNNTDTGTASEGGITFLLPFMDIEMQIERNTHIMQDSTQQDLYVLHGHELYQLFISRREKRLSLLGYLEGNIKIAEAVTAEAISWQGHLYIVVALNEYLEIYQIRRDILQSRLSVFSDPRRNQEMPLVFPAMQQHTLRGRLQKLFLVTPTENRLMIIAVVSFSKLYGKIRTFEWTKKGFAPLEELTIPAVSFINVIGSETKHLVVGKSIRNKPKTILNIYEVDTTSLHLQNIQTLTVDSLIVHSASFRNKNVIIACADKQTRCYMYLQMSNGLFAAFRERPAQELSFDHVSSTIRYIMASRQNRVMIFTDHHLDCYGSFTSELGDITKLIGHHNSDGENYALVIFKTPFRYMIRSVELELDIKVRMPRATKGGEVSLAAEHKMFIKSLVDQVRSFLPPRKEDMNIFHRMTDLMLPKAKRFETKKTPSNPFEKFAQMFMPKRSEPEEIDLYDLIEEFMQPNARRAKATKTSIFDIMEDVVNPTNSKLARSRDPLTSAFDSFMSAVRPKRTTVETDEPLTVKSGKINKIKITNTFLRSPRQILDKISELRTKILGGQRAKRSVVAGPYNITLELSNHVKVHKMKVKNLIYDGELLKGFSLNLSSKPLPTLDVKPKVRTHRLNANELALPQHARGIRQFIPDLYYDLNPSLGAKHLKLDSINGIPWTEFYESIYLRNRDTTIVGRLVLQSQVDVEHLKTPKLNDIVVDKLFNLRQPQVIHSDLVISRFLVHDLTAEQVNSLKFEEDIVFSGREAYVETPVTIHRLSISGDLIVADKKIERFSSNPDDMEFKQIYTNKVIINGTLVVKNLKRENDNLTKIIIGEDEFHEDDIKKKYLLNDEEQHFEFSVVFDNTKVIAPHLETRYLNEHITEEHMLTNRVNNSKPLLIVFMKTEVQGNIICRDYKSKIAEIKENLIRPGEVVKITGNKKFEAPVATDDLETYTLNQLPVTDLIFKSELTALTFRDSKMFNKIIVRDSCFVEKGIESVYLNHLPVEDLLNHDYYMDRLYVPHNLLASNIVFHKINGIPFDEFFTKLGVSNNQLILHKDLIVEGNVVFAEPVALEYINDLKWNDYVGNLARTNQESVIEGHICINGDLTITDELWSAEVNNYNLQDIFNNVLMKSEPQLITGLYTFDNMKASNVDVLSINGRSASEFIDLSKNYTEFTQNVKAPKIVVKGSVKGVWQQPMNFDNLSEGVNKLMSKTWANIQVIKNVSWPQVVGSPNTQQELLKYLYKNAVRSNRNHNITGNVKLLRPNVKNMKTRLRFPQGMDLDFMAKDAVLKNSTIVQTIKAFKNFLKPIYVENLKAAQGVNTELLNNIDILGFNRSLYRLSSKMPLKGSLQFLQPLTIGHLAAKGFINGLNTSLIYQIQNNSSLPPVALQQLFIDNNVRLSNINHMSVDYFLDNRVTLNGPALEIFGFLSFENVIIEKAALLQSINAIPIDNLVFKHRDTLQTLTGHKSITGSVELAGPAHVMRLNGRDLMEMYRNTLFNNRNYEFDNLLIDKVTFEQGLRVSTDDIRSRTFSETDKMSESPDFKKFLHNINENLTSKFENILYLDYDLQTTVKWQKPRDLSKYNISLQEVSRVSCCENQFLKIALSKVNKEIFLETITSNRLSAFANSIAVKVENYCKFKYRKVKSKISITAQKILKVFGMKRYIGTIDILSDDVETIPQFVVLHALDLPTLKRNEVRIFKIDTQNNSVQDWQGLTQNIGEQLKVFKLPNDTKLITNGLVDNHPALTMYHFNKTLQKFKLQQIIDGDYDIIEMLQMPNSDKQLIISCRKCQKIFIYEFTAELQPNYQIFQIISLKSNIDKLLMFSHKTDNYMLVITETPPSYYHLFKYSYIRGWLHITYGYYPNLQMAIPLTHLWDRDDDSSDSKPLLVLCSEDKCHLVNAIVQK